MQSESTQYFYSGNCILYIIVGAVPRTAVTFTTNLTCGDRCFKHTDNLTSIMEINRQDDLINEALKTTEKTELKYNKTDVIIRYFSGDKGPVIYPWQGNKSCACY